MGRGALMVLRLSRVTRARRRVEPGGSLPSVGMLSAFRFPLSVLSLGFAVHAASRRGGPVDWSSAG
ncbi:MAG: hypothetical protein CMN31_25995, partial [Sandaracinus sp.]|nr:hypothetical protein [Myxococcales bacterium]MBJ74742.1 hypothetical protein [Sandaracinus sp.]